MYFLLLFYYSPYSKLYHILNNQKINTFDFVTLDNAVLSVYTFKNLNLKIYHAFTSPFNIAINVHQHIFISSQNDFLRL